MLERVPIATVQAFVRALGFEPRDVCRIDIDSQWVRVAEFRRDDDGRITADVDNEPALITTAIPITCEEH